MYDPYLFFQDKLLAKIEESDSELDFLQDTPDDEVSFRSIDGLF